MIFGHVHRLQDIFASLPQPLQIAVAYLRDTDFDSVPAGRHDLQGDDIFAIVADVTTADGLRNRPEAHRQYIDVQFVWRGHERYNVAVDTGGNAVAEDLLAERDLLFFDRVDGESSLIMTAGNFAIFFPTDIHHPCLPVGAPEAIRKVIVKVRTALLSASATA